MDSFVLVGLRIALLALLWFFIFVALRCLRRDVLSVTGAQSVASTSKVAAPQGLSRTSSKSSKPRVLTVIEGPATGASINVAPNMVIGRGADCDLVLGDDYASGRHARIFSAGDDWFVEDLDSRNGTFVNGFRIDQPEQIGVNTDIRVGRTTVRLVP